MAQDPEAMKASMIANLPEKTGKSLEAWIRIVQDSGLEKHGEIMKLLKGEHGMTHGFANLVTHEARSAGQAAPAEEGLVAAQYAGAKAGLRPIYERLVDQIQGFGEDVEIAPKKTYVSLRRGKQFGLIKAATKSRIDLGINLAGEPETERLQPAGSLGMVSHKVALGKPDEVDAELLGWLREAYGRA